MVRPVSADAGIKEKKNAAIHMAMANAAGRLAFWLHCRIPVSLLFSDPSFAGLPALGRQKGGGFPLFFHYIPDFIKRQCFFLSAKGA